MVKIHANKDLRFHHVFFLERQNRNCKCGIKGEVENRLYDGRSEVIKQLSTLGDLL